MKYFIEDSFRGGVSDENDKGIKGSFKFGYGLDIHKRDDTLTCMQAMKKESGTTINCLINKFVTGSDGTTYCFGASGSIFTRSGNIGDPDYRFAFNDTNGKITGGAEWQLDTGVNYLYWATNTSVARKRLPGDDTMPWTDANHNLHTTLTSADYHTISMAIGRLMIANSNQLGMVGYDGSFTPSALNLQPHNIAKCFEERDDNLIIGSYRQENSEKGYIWSWISTALNWVQKKKIPIQGVNALITTEIPLLQGGSDGEIFLADFTNSTPLHAFIGGGQVNPNAVTIENDIAVFGVYNGTYPGIWSYGRRGKSRPFTLNYNYRLSPTVATNSTVTEIGAVEMVNGVLLASWKVVSGSTIEYGVDCVSSTTKASAIFESLEFDAGLPHTTKNFQMVKLIMSPMPASCGVSLKYKMNKGATWKTAYLGDRTTTTFSITGATEADFIIPETGQIFERQVTLTPYLNTTPEILATISYIDDEGLDI